MELDTRPSKRIKLDDSEHAIFDDPSLQRSASEICKLGLAGVGFLSGKVFMAWAQAAKKLRFIMQTGEMSDYGASKTHRFFVVFSGACRRFFANLALHAGDEIAVSLKGAYIEPTGEVQRSCTLAMTLVYSEGVIMLRKHTSGTDSGKIIDTWKLSQNWFDSPPPEEAPRNVTPPQDNIKNDTMKITKKGKRRQWKAQRQMETGDQAKMVNQAKEDGAVHDKPSPHDVTDKTLDLQLTNSSPVNQKESPSTNTTSNGQEMKAGLRTDTCSYYPIGEVSLKKTVDLIGVVVHTTSPTQTRTGDWCVNVKIVDPSSSMKADSNSLEAFAINCFTKQHTSWLPKPNAGDVLILRCVQIYNVKGHLKGTAHHNRFQWGIFSPEWKRVHHGDSCNTPEPEKCTDKGKVDSWTPFLDPCLPEIDYCVKLSEWWNERGNKQKQATHGIQEVHVARASQDYESMGGKRHHRLIKDADPEIQPSGYFDCTIEVLYGCMNDNGVYSLYVTDYTKHDRISPVQASWCPSELSEYVFKMEMWDAAAKKGPTMEPRSYYTISNARMRWSRGQYLEGKVVLPKIFKLDEKDADRIPHLKDLLARKKEWNDQHGIPSNIEDKLIEDAVEDEFFNCIVEALHVANSEYGLPCIYVTDYTTHPYLEAIQLEGEWSKGLEGRVVKVSLRDCHTSIANSVTPGFYYSVKKLRLRLSFRGDHFEGELRGYERLIHQLNPRTTQSEQLQQLLRRKEHFLKQGNVGEDRKFRPDLKGKESSSMSSRIPTYGVPGKTEDQLESEDYLPRNPDVALVKEKTHQEVTVKSDDVAQRFISLKEMVADETTPNKFLVRARAVDFYPFSLKECSKQFCTQCKIQVLDKYKACIECGDTAHSFVAHRYQILLRLEDNEGIRVVVTAYDKSHLFDRLERANFIDDPKAYNQFCARLSPLLGNLVEVHENGLRGVETAPDTQTHELEIVSWNLSDGSRVYGLFQCRGLTS